MKKLFVVTVLFALPLVAYLFFASGVNKFARLPILTKNIGNLEGFRSFSGEKTNLKGHITVLGFFGKNPLDYTVGAYNLAEKIYDPYHEFKDFQFVSIVEEGNEAEVSKMIEKLGKVVDMDKWKFVFGSEAEIKQLFKSLNTNLILTEDHATQNIFIVDKKANLRGRNEDEEEGLLYGYDSRSIAEINNKMDDDVKVILAEYRLELKKYNSNPKNER